MTRRIAVLTGTRAEFGLLRPLCQAIEADPQTELALIVTGMHLSPEFGMTVNEIEAEGLAVAERVDMLLSSDSPVGIAKSMGLGMIGYADALARLKPDILVVLGDRFETFAAAAAAMVACIPIAHIHGGEATEGAIDEAIRHAITKMAHLHFPATDLYRRRILQMGEAPQRVFNVGALALDTIRTFEALDRSELSQILDLTLDESVPLFVVTFHPVTLELGQSRAQLKALLAALDNFPQANIVLTYPNADTDGRALIAEVDKWAARRPENTRAVASLGQKRYLSLMKIADAVIGNSSSGLIEAPQFGVPTVNIGERQRGRIMGPSVISCPPEQAAITASIEKALDADFRAGLANMDNPYGDGTAALRILNTLKSVTLDESLLKKTFQQIEVKA